MRKHLMLTKRIPAFVFALVIAFSFVIQPLKAKTVHAEENETETELDDVSEIFSLDKTIPKDYYTTPDSAYNNIDDQPFLLSEQNELYFLSSSGLTKTATVFDTVDLSDYTSSGDKVNEQILKQSINKGAAKKATNVYSGMDKLSNLDYSKGVAFDPTGSGRKDHVAVFGLTMDYDGKTKKYSFNTKLVVQNTKTGKSYSKVFNYPMNWMAGSALWTSGSYFSITAGDYDRDGKDTVMIYATGDNDMWIYEVRLEKEELVYEGLFNVGLSLKNKRYDFMGANAPAYKKIVVSLATGDFDGDGGDELAYMAGYYKTFNKKNGYEGAISSLEPYSANIAIFDKNNNGKWTPTQPVFLYTKGDSAGEKNSYYYQILHGGAIAAGDVDGDGVDDIVAVGYTSKNCAIKFANNKMSYVKNLENFDDKFYGCAVVKYNGRGYSFSDVQQMQTSNFFQAHFTNSDSAFQPITVACAKVNGDKNAEYVFVNGVIFSFEMGAPTPAFEGDMRRDLGSMLGGLTGSNRVNSSVNWIENVTVGNFDGNEAGREQFVFVALEKHSGKDKYSANLGVIAGIDYSDVTKDGKVLSYGTTSKFASSLYMEDAYYHNKNMITSYEKNATQIFVDAQHSTYDNHLTFLPIAIDNDNDGILARQGKKGYAYTDPSLIAVLQAGPYYGELDDAAVYQDSCETVYSFETSYEYATSSGDNVSFGVGFAGELQAGNFKASLEIGYSLDWSHTFEKATEKTYSTEFAIGQEDAVVIQRTPEIVYCYDVYQNGRWVKNGYTMRVAAKPVFFLLTIDDYNNFVDQYNAQVKSEVFKHIGIEEMPEDHIGNPFAYFSTLAQAGTGAQLISDSDYSCQPGTGSITSSYSVSNSKSESREMSHGFSFSLTLQGGFNLLGDKVECWAGGYLNLDYSRSSGSSKTTTNSKSASGTVVNPDKSLMKSSKMNKSTIDSYHFTWNLIKWTRELQKDVDVPFYGYLVKNVSAPAIPVSDFDGVFKNAGDKKANIVLTWTDPGDKYRPTKGFIIYQYDEEGKKTQIATPSKTDTEYVIENVKATDEFKFTIVCICSINNKVSKESTPVELSAKNKNIYDIQMTSTEDLVDTYTIYYTDGSTSEFTVKNGEKGEKGDKGDKGDTGAPGASGGGSFTVTASPLVDPTSGSVFGVIINYPDGSKLYTSSDGSVFVYPNGTRVGMQSAWDGIQSILNPSSNP